MRPLFVNNNTKKFITFKFAATKRANSSSGSGVGRSTEIPAVELVLLMGFRRWHSLRSCCSYYEGEIRWMSGLNTAPVAYEREICRRRCPPLGDGGRRARTIAFQRRTLLRSRCRRFAYALTLHSASNPLVFYTLSRRFCCQMLPWECVGVFKALSASERFLFAEKVEGFFEKRV